MRRCKIGVGKQPVRMSHWHPHGGVGNRTANSLENARNPTVEDVFVEDLCPLVTKKVSAGGPIT